MDAEVGQVIAGRYRLERLLGEGGMGTVWAATHLVTRKPVALKFLKAAAVTEMGQKRFLREARAASAVRHTNVVGVHDLLEHGGLPVMVLDLLQGESLGDKLARERRIPLGELAQILVPVVSAVGTAHSVGIVHRDIKPDNVFLHRLPDGTVEPKVLDFGIAKLSATEGEAAATAHLTGTGAVMGTPYYMAPEQVFGEKDLDHRADVWAMGVMAYECLSGKKPIDGANVGQLFKAIVTGDVVPLEQIAPELPEDVTRAVGNLLRVKREERAPDLRELYAVLRRHASVTAIDFGGAAPIAKDVPLDTSPGAVTGDGVAQTLPGLPRSRRLPFVVAALGFGTLAVGGTLLWRASNLNDASLAAAASAAGAAPSVEAALAPPPPLEVPPPPSASAPSAPDAGAPSAVKGASSKRPSAPPSTSTSTSTSTSATPTPAASRQKGAIVEGAPF